MRPSALAERGGGIRSPELFATYPYIGLAMFLCGGLVFGLITYHLLANGSLLRWDVPLAERMHATALQSPGWVKTVMIAGYFVGDQIIAVIGVGFAIYFLRKRYWRELTMLFCGFALSALLFLLMAFAFDRPRPAFEPELWGGANIWGWKGSQLPSFPSGHAMAVISSYGLLTYLLVPRIQSKLKKGVVLGVFLLVVLYVNFSRLFLCDHFLSDIVAGTGFGVAWLGLSQTAVELLFRKRSSTPRLRAI